MDPQKRFCPNPACPARGQIAKGNVTIHSPIEGRYLCRACQTTFTETKGTAFYHLKTDPATVSLVMTLVSHGCPLEAIQAAFGVQPRTVRRWMARAGEQCERVHAHLVAQPQAIEQVQADELRVKLQKQVVWVAMALSVRTRLWLGAVESPIRDGALAHALMATVKACVRPAPVLFATDGWSPYRAAIEKTFREPHRSGPRGRPRLVAWAGRVVGQVVKRVEKRRVKAIERRLIEGTEAELTERLEVSQGGGTLNTAYIERLNATFRSWLVCLVRKTRRLARQPTMLHAGVYLIGTVYNFCCFHDSLTLDKQPRTPVMAAGLTDHRWSVRELLSYRVPLPPWRPPKRRGRRSRAEQALIERWVT
jgi:transposase-like protein/IS1 family transposase